MLIPEKPYQVYLGHTTSCLIRQAASQISSCCQASICDDPGNSLANSPTSPLKDLSSFVFESEPRQVNTLLFCMIGYSFPTITGPFFEKPMFSYQADHLQVAKVHMSPRHINCDMAKAVRPG